MSALPDLLPNAEREFYARHLAAAFRHSRPFRAAQGAAAAEVVASAAYDAILGECAAGSLEAARRIGELAMVRLSRAQMSGPAEAGIPGAWWRDLLTYERSCFLQLATTADPPPANRPRRGLSALCLTFAWQMPAVLERLARGEPVTGEQRRAVTLLFSRRQLGEACVIEVGPEVERVFRATNGLRTVEQIAAAAQVDGKETEILLESLAGVGAALPAMSSAEMTRALAARERR